MGRKKVRNKEDIVTCVERVGTTCSTERVSSRSRSGQRSRYGDEVEHLDDRKDTEEHFFFALFEGNFWKIKKGVSPMVTQRLADENKCRPFSRIWNG